MVPFEAVHANVRVPFSLSPLRIGLMVALLALVLAWRPGSGLWRVPLDTSSVRQRVWLSVLLAVPSAATLAVVVWQLVAAALSFHADGMYTYDFDQYDHVARALLDGHTWLDLDTPDALRDAANPYDVGTRQRCWIRVWVRCIGITRSIGGTGIRISAWCRRCCCSCRIVR